jgi:hypothetical protein
VQLADVRGLPHLPAQAQWLLAGCRIYLHRELGLVRTRGGQPQAASLTSVAVDHRPSIQRGMRSPPAMLGLSFGGSMASHGRRPAPAGAPRGEGCKKERGIENTSAVGGGEDRRRPSGRPPHRLRRLCGGRTVGVER